MSPGATTWSIHVNTDYVSWLTAILAGHFLLMNHRQRGSFERENLSGFGKLSRNEQEVMQKCDCHQGHQLHP